ncbi:MAG: DUF1997 domain-containing protein [Synechococcales cyanobacterium RM1_1_8]|nr:DUF1997 domain-containing protein [Synechococcales cyanobacterium RM1_1_8]
MQNQFTASQTVEIAVQEAGLPIEQYLSAPDRIVAGLTDPGGVEQLGPEEFRLRLRPLHFLSLRFVPVALLRVYNPAPGELCIESQDCQLLGAEGFNQRFQLQLRGRLRSERARSLAGAIARALARRCCWAKPICGFGLICPPRSI